MLNHPNPEVRQRWVQSAEKEFGSNFQGFGDAQGNDVLRWIPHHAAPPGKRVTHPRKTIAWRPEKEKGGGEQHRARITAGGNLLPHDGETSATGASLETAKIHWNSVIS